ncbi:MAG TPA: hypothetical protein VD963_07100 [Phycisphaerales bacterium]|nr:hypothetical protein [Phycisphaerales bacterium]
MTTNAWCTRLCWALGLAAASTFGGGAALALEPGDKQAGDQPPAQAEPWADFLQPGMTEEEVEGVMLWYKENFGGGGEAPAGLRGPGVNDVCSGATAVTLPAGGQVVLTDNNATATDDAGLALCGLSSATGSGSGRRGLWYTFTGTGNTVTVDTCSSAIALDLSMRIFCNDCTTPLCVAADDDGCTSPNFLAPRATFCTQAGVAYFVLVSRFGTTGAGGAFTLTFTDNGVACTAPACGTVPANDLCENAIALTLGSTVVGFNGGATDDAIATGCGTNPALAGVWYTIVGDGGLISLTTCNAETGFNSRISVFTGVCGGQTCVINASGGSTGCGFRDDTATTVFCSMANQTYYVLVSGDGTGGSGVFGLTATAAGFCPPNDNCGGAIPIAVGSSGTFNNVAATADPGQPTCSGLSTFNNGLWFTVTGNGNRLEATTCNPGTDSNTRVYVYSGTCGALTCVAANATASPACGIRPDAASVRFCTNQGEVYYVLVTPDTTTTGNFELSIIDRGSCAPPANDFCAGAIPLPSIPGGGSVGVTGSTETATIDTGEAATCVTTVTGPGVWYTVQGTGAVYTVSTCNPGTNFDTKLHIYTGGCGSFTCVTGNADAGAALCTPSNRSIATFCSTPGQTYWVLVSGQTATATGDFELTVTEVGGCATNDLCENAIPVTVGSSGTFNNSGATSETGLPICNSFSVWNMGVWFTVTGNGNRLNVNTCGPATNFNTRVYIFSGTCGNFTCVGANAVASPACDLRPDAAAVSFCSNPGEVYYVLVTNDTTGSGTFSLNVADQGSCAPPANDACAGAVSLGALPAGGTFTVSGNNVNATPDTGEAGTCVTTVTGNGMWYTFTAPAERVVRVSTCSAATTFDTKVLIYQGVCGALTCVTGNADAGTGLCSPTNRAVADFCAAANITYYVLVTGQSATATGDFELTVTDLQACLPNDTCTGATAMSVPGSGIFNNIGATNDPGQPTCTGLSTFNSGVWFTFTGNGQGLEVNTCSPSTDFNTRVYVYTGSCGALTCVRANATIAGACLDRPDAATARFCSIAGQQYWVLVTNDTTGSGNFGLNIVVAGACPANDNCGAAVAVTPGTYNGDLNFATNDGTGSCNSTAAAPDLWYSYTATCAGTLTVTTCGTHDAPGQDQGMDTVLTLFDGSCAGAELACDDDATDAECPGDAGTNRDSFVTTPVFAGQVVLIRVASFGTSNPGTFILNVADDCPPSTDCNQNSQADAAEIAANPALDCFTRTAGPVGGFHQVGGPNGALDVCECQADFNRDGAVSTSDISSFLSSWFDDISTGQLKADINCSGTIGTNDISTFLNIWFGALSGQPPFNGC